MNEPHEHRELESLIARQALRKPSAKLDDRMKHLFSAGSQESVDAAQHPGAIASPWFRWVLMTAAMLAIVSLIGLVLLARARQNQLTQDRIAIVPEPEQLVHPASNKFNPVRIEQSWSNLQPEGVVMIDGDPVRRFQRETVEHVQLIDEKNNIRIEYTLPRRETIVMPVKYD